MRRAGLWRARVVLIIMRLRVTTGGGGPLREPPMPDAWRAGAGECCCCCIWWGVYGEVGPSVGGR